MSGISWRRVIPIIAPVSLVFLVVLLYGQSLSNQLVWDDEDNIIGNPALRQSPFTGGFLASPSAPTRLLTNLSFAVEYRLWGLNPIGYHATNLLLHLVNVLLVYFLMMRFSAGEPARASPASSPAPMMFSGAWCAGMLFAVHPVHVEAVNSIALGRDYLLATMCGLVALLCVTMAVRPPVGERRLARWRWMGGAAVAALGSLFSHEIGAIVIPMMAMVWFQQQGWEAHQPLTRRVGAIGLIVMGGVLLLSLFWLMGGAGEMGRRVAPVPAVTVLMVKQLAVPVPLCLWYDAAAVGEPGVLGPLAGVALLVMLLFVGMTYRVRQNVVGRFGFLLMCLALVPVLVREALPLPLPSVMGERWLYLPSAFFAMWVGSFAALGRSIAVRLLIGLLVMLGVSGGIYTITQNSSWRNNIEVFHHAVEHCPPSAYLRAALGKAYYDHGETEKARGEFLAAMAIDPNFPRARIGMGLVALETGDVVAALREFSTVLTQAPANEDVHNGLGEVYFRLHRYDAAIHEFQLAIALRPSLSTFHWNLALALMKAGRLEEAIAEWRQVLAITPDPDERETAREEIGRLMQAVTRGR
jgi:Flp pilus assembly protein TadD